MLRYVQIPPQNKGFEMQMFIIRAFDKKPFKKKPSPSRAKSAKKKRNSEGKNRGLPYNVLEFLIFNIFPGH